MHYIGSMEEGQSLYKLFKYLGLLNVPLNKLDPNAYDIISIAGENYQYAMGKENFIETLAKAFPKRRNDLKTYMQRISEVAGASPLYNLRPIKGIPVINPDYIKISVNDFIASVTSDEKLQNVLAGNLPLYAGIKDKTPTYIYALINAFYIQSAFQMELLVSDKIAHSLAESIRVLGENYTLPR